MPQVHELSMRDQDMVMVACGINRTDSRYIFRSCKKGEDKLVEVPYANVNYLNEGVTEVEEYGDEDMLGGESLMSREDVDTNFNGQRTIQ